jgi:hypothetical protein
MVFGNFFKISPKHYSPFKHNTEYLRPGRRNGQRLAELYQNGLPMRRISNVPAAEVHGQSRPAANAYNSITMPARILPGIYFSPTGNLIYPTFPKQ